ncbi:eukaryotic translation initiation factor 3 subunit H [Phymastichus coffea]|uniref:eukaryotic translation initiation factor 3 subunit H n=1 Tax=Phymastichus coffea TaxID=108790 RepID=UPI00273C66C7|nr:eukaryotic translation initiation factor 3 subunit H [Phymastichus coffea]XP_058790358.1 eukaryotic translation initiation factor 3 subunit H [Phymastichus coffea]
MSSRNPSRRVQEMEPRIDYVQCDGLVVMKMVKHCHEEASSNMEVAQGALLGLNTQGRLEITNCFPFSKNDDFADEEDYQLNMMRRLRIVNVDHFHVGWYQSADVGNFLSLPLLESQYHYQTSIEESVVIIYDTAKSARGFLTLKAYRLTPQAIQMYKDGEFTPEALKNLKIGYENLFVELPIVIRNSALTNIVMSELEEMVPEEEGTKYLDLGTASVLENQLRCMMDRVDELNQEAIKFNRYQSMVIRQQQDKNRLMQKRAQENAARAAKDEPPLPEEDINKLIRPIPVPLRLNPMITAGQINTYSQHISQFCAQSLAKLYITQSLQNAKEAKSSTQ